MFRFINKITESFGLSYPEEYLSRIQYLKRLAEEEIAKVIDDILTKPQCIVGRSDKLLLVDALKEGQTIVEIEAPLLTFPRATPDQWNGTIDHMDAISGTYYLYEGDALPLYYGDHLLKRFSGAPKICPALKKALGPNYQVTMITDAYKSPASRFVIVLPKSL